MQYHGNKYDWTCPTCKYMNFGRNTKCKKCNTLSRDWSVISRHRNSVQNIHQKSLKIPNHSLLKVKLKNSQ